MLKLTLGAVLALSLSLNAAANTDYSTAARTVQEVNKAVQTAGAANQEKRYADAEALMLKVTAEHPVLIAPRVELGVAQLGLHKLPEAEASFKLALGIDPRVTTTSHSDDFYQQGNSPEGESTHLSRNTMGGSVISKQSRTPEVKGLCLSSLGEVYIRTKRYTEGQQAFDEAVKANPTQAAFYLRNETIFFYQVNNPQGELTSADKAIAVDPNRAMLYFFKGHALAATAASDSNSQGKLPQAAIDAYKKYLALEPNGQFAGVVNKALAADASAQAAQ